MDQPTGKNDGSVEGKRYFKTRQNHGVVRSDCVPSVSPKIGSQASRSTQGRTGTLRPSVAPLHPFRPIPLLWAARALFSLSSSPIYRVRPFYAALMFFADAPKLRLHSRLFSAHPSSPRRCW